jgi:hypothetical protein
MFRSKCISSLITKKNLKNEKREEVKRQNYATILLPSGVSWYLSLTCFTNPALTSSLKPLRTLNRGCPVLSATALGVEAPLFKADNVAIPLLVGFPSADTHGKSITAS